MPAESAPAYQDSAPFGAFADAHVARLVEAAFEIQDRRREVDDGYAGEPPESPLRDAYSLVSARIESVARRGREMLAEAVMTARGREFDRPYRYTTFHTVAAGGPCLVTVRPGDGDDGTPDFSLAGAVVTVQRARDDGGVGRSDGRRTSHWSTRLAHAIRGKLADLGSMSAKNGIPPVKA